MLFTRDLHQLEEHTETKSEQNSLCRQKPKKTVVAISTSDKRLKDKPTIGDGEE